MKVLVTGASGLLATNTIIQLLNKNYSVRALVRNQNKLVIPNSENIEVLEGDITDPPTLEDAIRGCQCIVHAAAETRQNLIDYKNYSEINVLATRNICELAIKNKVSRVIYVSTANVFGYGDALNPGNEETPNKLPFIKSFYVKSKIEAQEIALSYRKELEIIVVNPTFLIGAYDQKPSSGRLVLMGLNKRFIFYPPGGKNFIHVSDAAMCIANFVTKGKNGEAYLLANQNLSYKTFFEKLSKFSDKKPLLIPIPIFVLIVLGKLGNLLGYLGINNEIMMTNMQILCTQNFYSNNKIKEQFQFEFKSIEIAIKDSIEWFKNNYM
jgi:dihydroflavonol-4-reductase